MDSSSEPGNQRASLLGSPSLLHMAGLSIHDHSRGAPGPPLLHSFIFPNAQCYPRGRMAEFRHPRSSFADRPWNGRPSRFSPYCNGHRGVQVRVRGDRREAPLHDTRFIGFDPPFFVDRCFPTDRQVPVYWNPVSPLYLLPNAAFLPTPRRPDENWSVFGRRFPEPQDRGTVMMTRGQRRQGNFGSVRGHGYGYRNDRGSSSGCVPIFTSAGQGNYPVASEQDFSFDCWVSKDYTSFEDKSK